MSSFKFNSDSCAGCVVEKCARCIEEPCTKSERVCELCSEGKQDTQEFQESVDRLENCQEDNLKKDVVTQDEAPIENDPYLDNGYTNPSYENY